jgi:hypothetical protein
LRRALPVLSTEFVLRKNRQVAWRVIVDEAVLVPVARSRSEAKTAYVLNETAARVWELLDGTRSLGEILETVVSEYEVDASEASRDLNELIEHLLTLGVIEEVNE